MNTAQSFCLGLFAASALAIPARAASVNVIFSFEGGADGEYTDTDLVRDTAGNLYGT